MNSLIALGFFSACGADPERTTRTTTSLQSWGSFGSQQQRLWRPVLANEVARRGFECARKARQLSAWTREEDLTLVTLYGAELCFEEFIKRASYAAALAYVETYNPTALPDLGFFGRVA